MEDAGLDRAIEGTALRRAGVRGLRRNLAVAIGNAGPPLTSVVHPQKVSGTISEGSAADDARPSLRDPMVAEHVAWARSRPR
jgi:epoxyqueuosine reductase QueG